MITRPWSLLRLIKFKNHNVNFNLRKHQISVNIGITYQIHTHTEKPRQIPESVSAAASTKTAL